MENSALVEPETFVLLQVKGVPNVALVSDS